MERISTGNFLGSSLSVREQDETALESIQFGEEIQGLMAPASENASSFTALLELPPTEAMELLHLTECQGTTAAPSFSGKPLCQINDQEPHIVPSFNGNLAFPSNTALIERAAQYSVFAGENSLQEEASSVPPNSSANLDKVKNEPPETDSNPSMTQGFCDPPVENKNKNQRAAKRKEREKKVKGSSKKGKSVADDNSGDAEKLPYVHVRVRRGQATDSHSLAERARREKINARMKLLQELVPGCNKVLIKKSAPDDNESQNATPVILQYFVEMSGTALVLDEIINHVQFLQRQVEILSMKLAAVNPRIDFSLDSILATEGASLMNNNFPSMVAPLVWPEISTSGNRQQHQQPWQFDTLHQPPWVREEDNHNFMTPENSLMSYDSSANSASLHSNQSKMEL